jgi:hypothetical protein
MTLYQVRIEDHWTPSGTVCAVDKQRRGPQMGHMIRPDVARRGHARNTPQISGMASFSCCDSKLPMKVDDGRRRRHSEADDRH